MIIFGTNSSLLSKEPITESCPNCLNINCVEMYVLQKYAHIFWIPFFPIGKTGMSICGHCKKVMKLNEMPDTYKMTYQNARQHARTPVWTFAGLVLTALVAGWLTYQVGQSDKQNAERISSPKKGDLYTVKNEESRYMLYKVSDARGDTVFILYSQFDVNKSKYTKDILKKGEGAFYDEEIPILKSDLLKMLDDRTILSVERN